jgi:hypothetical protein
MSMAESEVVRCLVNVVNERIGEINFYRPDGQHMSAAEQRARVEGWLREALFPSTPRVKDKPAKGAK